MLKIPIFLSLGYLLRKKSCCRTGQLGVRICVWNKLHFNLLSISHRALTHITWHSFPYFLCFAKESNKERRFFSKGSAGKKGLYAVIAVRLQSSWRWFSAYHCPDLAKSSGIAKNKHQSFECRIYGIKRRHHILNFPSSIVWILKKGLFSFSKDAN